MRYKSAGNNMTTTSSVLLKFIFALLFAVKSVVNARSGEIVNELELIDHKNIIFPGDSVKPMEYEICDVHPLLISNGEIVTVSFKTLAPNRTDFIAAYSPSNVDITSTVPVRFAKCESSPYYMKSGSGSLTFNFTNLRADIAFYYFTGTVSRPIMVSKFPGKVSFKDINEPLRPRIVPVGSEKPDSFKLLWSSASSTEPTMLWGTKSGKYDHKVSASTSHLNQSDMCGGRARTYGWRDLGLIHTALLQGMTTRHANKKIFYIFGDAATKTYSKEHIFNVPPPAGAEPAARPTRAIVYCDMGRGSNDSSFTWNEYGRPSYLTALRVGGEVADGSVDVIFHGGDISYAIGFAAVWDFFLDMISPFAGSVPYLTTVGNHESDWPGTASLFKTEDSGGECGVSATTLIPPPSPASRDRPWWSYDVGLIHFIGISTEHDFTVGSEQYSWLESDLKKIDRTKTPWVILNGHRAMYVNSDYGGPEYSDIAVSDKLIENIEPLLFRYRVNVAFYGHNHVYQRHTAVYAKSVVQKSELTYDEAGNPLYWYEDPEATVHFVVGSAGAGFTYTDVKPPPEWNEVIMYRWGYARITVESPSELWWEFVESSSGKVFDRAVITQSQDWQTRQWSL